MKYELRSTSRNRCCPGENPARRGSDHRGEQGLGTERDPESHRLSTWIELCLKLPHLRPFQ